MIHLSLIREQPDKVRKGAKNKGEVIDLDSLLNLDNEHRSLLNSLNELREERNRVSQEIGKTKGTGKGALESIQTMKKVSQQIKELEEKVGVLAEQLNSKLLRIPNLPHDSVPIGKNVEDNVIIREWGDEYQFDFEPKSHLELGASLNLFDFERGAKISGSGFPLYMGKGAKLERALINFMVDMHVDTFGFTEVFPPFLVRREAMVTTGQLPKFEEDMYHTEVDDLFLIPTAEVPVTGIHGNEILEEEDLPIKYVAYSACFRREAGSYGKDTHGFLRLHQFNKVELVKYVTPGSSYDELEALTAQAESVLQALGLRYRVVELCTADLSFASAKCFDLEVWAPGEKKWLEVSSCSNFEGFQARRGNIRYRREDNRKVECVHTLNGSGVATPRLLVALLETYQREDGTVEIPDVLQAHLGIKELA
jgi:seryl-tRNA synthetase|tara:strand:- start:877 stop:2145 length:1269 start_codon:yes stop_codon:yes gene_type:complete